MVAWGPEFETLYKKYPPKDEDDLLERLIDETFWITRSRRAGELRGASEDIGSGSLFIVEKPYGLARS